MGDRRREESGRELATKTEPEKIREGMGDKRGRSMEKIGEGPARIGKGQERTGKEPERSGKRQGGNAMDQGGNQQGWERTTEAP